jgi:hypothetical protein
VPSHDPGLDLDDPLPDLVERSGKQLEDLTRQLRLRWIYVPAGLCMHIGIYLTLTAPFFQWIALYAVFIPWSEALRLL